MYASIPLEIRDSIIVNEPIEAAILKMMIDAIRQFLEAINEISGRFDLRGYRDPRNSALISERCPLPVFVHRPVSIQLTTTFLISVIFFHAMWLEGFA